jgi:hypothetical protein
MKQIKANIIKSNSSSMANLENGKTGSSTTRRRQSFIRSNVPRDDNLPPSESVNCHCIHRGIVNEDILGLPLAERKRLQAEAVAGDNANFARRAD